MVGESDISMIDRPHSVMRASTGIGGFVVHMVYVSIDRVRRQDVRSIQKQDNSYLFLTVFRGTATDNESARGMPASYGRRPFDRSLTRYAWKSQRLPAFE
jgi:hypothetical protein